MNSWDHFLLQVQYLSPCSNINSKISLSTVLPYPILTMWINFCWGWSECFPFLLSDRNCAALGLYHSEFNTVQLKSNNINLLYLQRTGLEFCSSHWTLFTSGEVLPNHHEAVCILSSTRMNDSFNHLMHPKFDSADQEMQYYTVSLLSWVFCYKVGGAEKSSETLS